MHPQTLAIRTAGPMVRQPTRLDTGLLAQRSARLLVAPRGCSISALIHSFKPQLFFSFLSWWCVWQGSANILQFCRRDSSCNCMGAAGAHRRPLALVGRFLRKGWAVSPRRWVKCMQAAFQPSGTASERVTGEGKRAWRSWVSLWQGQGQEKDTAWGVR